MNRNIQSLYKKLCRVAKEQKDADKLGVMPTHFFGENDKIGLNVPLFVGRRTDGLDQRTIPLINNYDCYIPNWIKGEEKRFRFWKVVGRSLAKSRGEKYCINVFRDFYWSNLYRINYRQQGIDTPASLRSKQINICAQLLLAEIDELNPSVSIFLTGINECKQKGVGRFWKHWQSCNQLKNLDNQNNSFTLIGESGKEHHCFAFHCPERKNNEAVIEKISEILKIYKG